MLPWGHRPGGRATLELRGAIGRMPHLRHPLRLRRSLHAGIRARAALVPLPGVGSADDGLRAEVPRGVGPGDVLLDLVIVGEEAVAVSGKNPESSRQVLGKSAFGVRVRPSRRALDWNSVGVPLGLLARRRGKPSPWRSMLRAGLRSSPGSRLPSQASALATNADFLSCYKRCGSVVSLPAAFPEGGTLSTCTTRFAIRSAAHPTGQAIARRRHPVAVPSKFVRNSCGVPSCDRKPDPVRHRRAGHPAILQ